jgi:hypothetical protein
MGACHAQGDANGGKQQRQKITHGLLTAGYRGSEGEYGCAG